MQHHGVLDSCLSLLAIVIHTLGVQVGIVQETGALEAFRGSVVEFL